MKLSEDLAWRGLIKDKTFSDNAWLDQPKSFYHGVDATADSLTIGNLAALLLARRLIDAGWQAVLLVGGATSLIGDPGGKQAERELMPREQVLSNAEAIKKQVSNLFAGQHFTPADNYGWFAEVKYLDFLREVGKSFSMTELMQREFVKERMGSGGSGISYAEFSYSLIQGYDYWQLFKKHQVELQIGGSDQWGNMLSGVSLIRKKEAKEVHALSIPLVVDKSTGQKFGKTEAGAVWLSAQKTGHADFYQFWINSGDEDVESYLKVFTLLSKDQIEKILTEHKTDPSRRIAQKLLADEVTRLVRGEDGLNEAKAHTAAITKPLEYRTETEFLKLDSGISLIDALAKTGLASSNSEARRLIESKAIYMNDKQVNTETLNKADFPNGVIRLRKGKKLSNTVLIQLN